MTDELMHEGTKRHSGRYPWGSGENPQQRNRDFLGCTLILTQCEAKEIELAPNGELKACTLSLTFEQASARWTSGESAQEEMVGGAKGGGGRRVRMVGRGRGSVMTRF